MNVKMKELQGKLAKSSRRTLMISTICGDDKFVNRVIDWDAEKTFESLDKWKDHWKETNDEEKFGDIAAAASMAFKTAGNKGKNAVERAKYFIEDFAGFLFEDKDELDKDDYCNAVVQLRLIGKRVLPDGKYIDPIDSRKDEPDDKTKAFSGEGRDKKTPFRWSTALQIANAAVKKADCEKGKADCDKAEASEARKILEHIKKDQKLSEVVGVFDEKFSNWIAEQLFGLNPDVLAVIKEGLEENRTTITLFNQYVNWLKDTDPHAYVEYLAKSTGDDTEEDSEKSDPITDSTGSTQNAGSVQSENQTQTSTPDNQKDNAESPITESHEDEYIGLSPYEIYKRRVGEPCFSYAWV